MPKINQEEYEILKSLDDKWKWIARDKDKTLVMGAGKNERYLDGWFPPVNVGDSLVVDETNAVKDVSEYGNLFQFIQWEDESPYNIEELIEGYESEEMTYFDRKLISEYERLTKESEETEVKNIEWLKEKVKEEHEYNRTKYNKEGFEGYAHREFAFKYVLKLINQLDEPEVLSEEWIDDNKVARINNLRKMTMSDVVPVESLENLLVPKQELPVIPKFVAEWIEETKPNNSLRVAFEYIAQRKMTDYDDELAFWVEEGNSETFARAWLDGYETEQEPKYYAKIKGHENIGSNDKYWNYNTDMEELSIGDSEVHPNVISEYTIKATKEEWANLGITDDNAEFELVEEIENE